MSNDPGPSRKIELEKAIQSLVESIRRSVIEDETFVRSTVNLELGFDYEERQGEIVPVVSIGESEKRHAHRVTIPLNADMFIENVGRDHNVGPIEVVPDIIDSAPPLEVVSQDRDKDKKGPKIVIPKKPMLKLMKASDIESARRGDDLQVLNADIEFRPEETSDGQPHPESEKIPKYVVLDHQIFGPGYDPRQEPQE